VCFILWPNFVTNSHAATIVLLIAHLRHISHWAISGDIQIPTKEKISAVQRAGLGRGKGCINLYHSKLY
jgi:hypothetical protein